MDRRSFLKIAAASALAYGTVEASLPLRALALTDEERWPAVRYSIADSHFHFADFIAETDGMDSLLKAMDSSGVEHIMFSGMPLIKKWNKDEKIEPSYYLDDSGRTYWYSATDFIIARRYMELTEENKNRFHPFICGFNATDKNAVDHIELMLQEYPDVWQGIGEIFGHRDDLTNLTYGETARANHPALDAVYELAAGKRLPVTLHNNATSRHRLDKPIYVHEVEDALRRHPKTVIIWAHAGLSRYLDLNQVAYTSMLGGMLKSHENLYIDLSWLVFENYIVAKGSPQTIQPHWLNLINRFPERFMIGSDSIGHFKNYNKSIVKYYALLDALSPDKAEMVAMDNFLGLLGN